MREILFRAKRIDNGEWVEGFCMSTDNKHYIAILKKYDGGGSQFIDIEVIPETVSQYVGLKDQDGKKIFEGDILESPVKRVTEKHGHLIVITDIRKCEFVALYVAEYKVIGNIHDNPELLEEI